MQFAKDLIVHKLPDKIPKSTAHCLKITQNVAFEFLAFSTDFCPIITDLSGNTVWQQASVFQKLAIFGIFS